MTPSPRYAHLLQIYTTGYDCFLTHVSDHFEYLVAHYYLLQDIQRFTFFPKIPIHPFHSSPIWKDSPSCQRFQFIPHQFVTFFPNIPIHSIHSNSFLINLERFIFFPNIPIHPIHSLPICKRFTFSPRIPIHLIHSIHSNSFIINLERFTFFPKIRIHPIHSSPMGCYILINGSIHSICSSAAELL